MDEFNSGRDPRARSSSSQFKLDEGFAEDSQQHGDQVQNSFVAWLNTQSDKAKADIAYEILRTLRSTDISSVVDRLNPFLHMDPIERLPPEITFQIFSYLDASTLLLASLSSQTWRERILDPRLWQDLYTSQGWGIDLKQVREFEEAHARQFQNEPRKSRDSGRSSFAHKGSSIFKRRATSDWLKSTPRRVSADVADWREQHSVIEADAESGETADAEMTDAPLGSPQRPNKRPSQNEGDDIEYRSPNSISLAPDISMAAAPEPPSDLILLDEHGQGRLNWPHFFKQRHKLEQNWLQGRFTNFQLPHPEHPQEAHTECVYTIQFYGKWLVSGSRDKTLRVWDLETRRLRGKPLVGHLQSVLCLQFDPTEEEDTIISGSSDSSIIVWKFSTGQKVQTIMSAHEESVLNLRFDHRYLVTCSKDKKIKVWNRKSLLPNDPDYPTARPNANCKIPNHIIDLSDIEISTLEANLANGVYKALKPYSHLMTLEGHSAAVNAIQIEDDKIVSASGDRHIRIWSIKSGTCPRLIPGHNKGIACVQYDGRRVVSGSSDNTVRIYDPLTSSEVAVLLGHSQLVRTVQAGFGDAPGSEDDYTNATKLAETELYQKMHSGTLNEDRSYARRLRNGEFGTSRLTFGSKLPPGGGGSKWARIVSGSYDESIIIWKKDDHGHWVIGQTLKQDDLFQSNIRVDSATQVARRQRRAARQLHDAQAREGSTNTASAPGGNNNNNNSNTYLNSHVSASQIVQATMNTSLASLQTSVQNLIGVNQSINNFMPNGYGPLLSHLQDASGPRSAQLRAQAQQLRSQVQQQTSQLHQLASQPVLPSTSGAAAAATASSSSSNRAQSQAGHGPGPNPGAVNTHPPLPAPMPAAQPPNTANNHNHRFNQAATSNNPSRVFKLQFDARRIVCCSQDSRIIGWDFANGDTEIEECARFFLGP